MADNKKKPVTPVTKPYIKGSLTDETTFKKAAGFFGLLAATTLMTFLVCSMTGGDSTILRLIINPAILLVILMIFYQRGAT